MSEDFPATSKGMRRNRGFEVASSLLRERVRHAGEARGFAVARLLTHWAEVVGPDLAPLCRPVKVGYGRNGFGATLTILVEGAAAPIVDMSRERIRERVNACYGYNAISRVMLTQTSASGYAGGAGGSGAMGGFAEAPSRFAAKPATPAPAALRAEARTRVDGCADETLRAALELLATNVLTRSAHHLPAHHLPQQGDQPVAGQMQTPQKKG